MWIAGNSLAETPHLIRSATGPNLTSWTTFTFPYPGFGATGGNYVTYQNFHRLSDGRLIFHIDQRDVGGAAEGKDNLAYILPLGSDTWTPLVSGTNPGEFLTSEPATGPQRVYLQGCFTEKYPHPDRHWITYVYRNTWTDVATQLTHGIIYNDTVTNSATWKRMDGTTQPMPVTYANSTTGGTALIPLDASQPYWYLTNCISIDRNGHPHIINGAAGTNRHYWHDGTTWQSEACATGATTPAPFTFRNNQTLLYREFGGRLVVSKILAGNPSFQCGNPVPTNWDNAYPDPIQQSNGILHLMIPDPNDNPEVCVIGDVAATLTALDTS
jgi:hypothetical protein